MSSAKICRRFVRFDEIDGFRRIFAKNSLTLQSRRKDALTSVKAALNRRADGLRSRRESS